MDDAPSIGVSSLVAIGTSIAAFLSVLTFWMKLSDRITKADAKADDAQQDAAEAKNDCANVRNDCANMREELLEMIRAMDDRLDRAARSNGENTAAIRQHVTDLAMFMRDNFVRTAEFTVAMGEIKAGQLRLETKFDRLSEQMRGGS
jgi:soluble cytochrome b562